MTAVAKPAPNRAAERPGTASPDLVSPTPRLSGPSLGASTRGFDDLTAIRGIGIAAENRLFRAGIRSFDALAKAGPERLKKILGDPLPGVSYESWIASARALSS